MLFWRHRVFGAAIEVRDRKRFLLRAVQTKIKALGSRRPTIGKGRRKERRQVKLNNGELIILTRVALCFFAGHEVKSCWPILETKESGN